MKVGAAVGGNKVCVWGPSGFWDLLGKKQKGGLQLFLLDRLNTALTNKQPSEAQKTWTEKEINKYYLFFPFVFFTVVSCALKLSIFLQ